MALITIKTTEAYPCMYLKAGKTLLMLSFAFSLLLWGNLAQALTDTLPKQPFPDDVFPIGVWLQQPKHAEKYRELGINLYVGLWKGPTAAQLENLKRAAMPVICTQNETGLTDPNRDIIIGWLHQDEPDNAQPLFGKIGAARLGFGSPIPPHEMEERYREMKLHDPTRPVYLNLGKGVAWDRWKGRGNRTGHPEDYPEYIKAADIVAFDIYPTADTDPALAGKLETVAFGVKRLVQWAGPGKKVWNVIGASRIHNPDAPVDPEQIRSQVWMSIISGSRGIVYFAHQFKPEFIEATWLNTPELAAAIRKINSQIQSLSKVIMSPESDVVASLTIHSEQREAIPSEQLILTSRRTNCSSYIFAASLVNMPITAKIQLNEPAQSIKVIDEGRALAPKNGSFTDSFAPYAVHLYTIPSNRSKCRAVQNSSYLQ